MNKTCADCVFVNNASGTYTCRFNSPSPYQTASVGSTNWPEVQAIDWCADGWNSDVGWYNGAPERLGGSDVT